MAHVVSMINWKGGVGKTTLTYHIGIGLWLFARKKTLLVDLDPQANLSFLALGGASKYTQVVYRSGGQPSSLLDLYNRYFDGKSFDLASLIKKQSVVASANKVWSEVDIVLSHQELILVDLKLAREKRAAKDFREDTRNELRKLSILADALVDVQNDYDYILLDCPPNINLTTQNALFASSHYVIPAKADFLSTVGISLIKKRWTKSTMTIETCGRLQIPNTGSPELPMVESFSTKSLSGMEVRRPGTRKSLMPLQSRTREVCFKVI
jgi:chromosome partitioning protein